MHRVGPGAGRGGARRRRHLPHRRLPGGGSGDLGHRGGHAVGRQRVEWLRDDLGIITTSHESEAVAAQCADLRRRLVRAGSPRPRNPRLGLRSPGHPRRPHQGFGAPRGRPGRPRGRGPPRSRPGRGVGARQRLPDRDPARRRRHVGQPGVRRGARRRHRTPGGDLARRWRRPRLARASWPGWPSAPTRRPRNWRTPSRPAGSSSRDGDDAGRASARERWLAARGKAEATIPELSGISF